MKTSPLVFGGCYAYLSPQQRKDVQATWFAFMNTVRTTPVLAFCIFDYAYTLNGLKYGTPEYFKVQSTLNTRIAQRMLKMFIKNRGIYIKAGQYIGSLDNIAPKEYVQVFRVLQDEGPSVSFSDIKIVIENDLQCKIEDIFSHFETTPIAAASLAQVHRATLRENGADVAVKIQFPTLKLQTKYDMKVGKACMDILTYSAKVLKFDGINLSKLYDDFKMSRIKELDF